jgi:protein associated with RNAse G/E
MVWKKRRSGKFNVAPKAERTWGGITYDSKKEMTYAKQLDLLQRGGEIISIERQVPYVFTINEVKICTYKLDFKVVYANGRTEYIDVKGVKTDVYNIKKKLLKAMYGIDIKEV